ncbi:MAG: M23 family metallopeptidase [Deltaproteobacteria bacterium]|nr:M23 family metallopeptidase [Deltaproteobacteria bacterium]
MSKFFDYLDSISQVNGLTNGMGNGQKIQWLFHCGMLFLSKDKWWGDFKFRHSAHEGIDITYYRIRPDKLHNFDNSIRVPAMENGIILNICNDFLGQTLVVEHENSLLFNRRLLFAYAHIIPEKNLKIGQVVKKGQVIATVCDTYKNPQLPPHLHFSCFEVLKKIPPEHLDWNLFFSDNLDVNLLHPIFL